MPRPPPPGRRAQTTADGDPWRWVQFSTEDGLIRSVEDDGVGIREGENGGGGMGMGMGMGIERYQARATDG